MLRIAKNVYVFTFCIVFPPHLYGPEANVILVLAPDLGLVHVQLLRLGQRLDVLGHVGRDAVDRPAHVVVPAKVQAKQHRDGL